MAVTPPCRGPFRDRSIYGPGGGRRAGGPEAFPTRGEAERRWRSRGRQPPGWAPRSSTSGTANAPGWSSSARSRWSRQPTCLGWPTRDCCPRAASTTRRRAPSPARRPSARRATSPYTRRAGSTTAPGATWRRYGSSSAPPPAVRRVRPTPSPGGRRIGSACSWPTCPGATAAAAEDARDQTASAPEPEVLARFLVLGDREANERLRRQPAAPERARPRRRKTQWCLWSCMPRRRGRAGTALAGAGGRGARPGARYSVTDPLFDRVRGRAGSRGSSRCARRRPRWARCECWPAWFRSGAAPVGRLERAVENAPVGRGRSITPSIATCLRPAARGHAAALRPQGTMSPKGARSAPDVEGEAVRRHPPRDAHADGRDLRRPTQAPVIPARAARETCIPAGPTGPLEVAHVAVDVVRRGRGSGSDSRRSGPGRGRSRRRRAGLEDPKPRARSSARGRARARLRVTSEGEDGVVLEEQEGVGGAAGLPLGHQPLLQRETLRVGHAAQPPDVQRARSGRRARRRGTAGGHRARGRTRQTPAVPS